MPSLQIHPTPFRPSRLGMPPSPHSPRSPLAALQSRYSAGSKASRQEFQKYTFACSSPPSTPLPWLWQCHLCNRTYAVGVTRRCLEDGHIFCAGEPSTTTIRGGAKRRVKQRKRGKACASEFDYQGWKAWGEWRRKEMAARTASIGVPQRPKMKKDCEHRCDYPSDCRWGNHATPASPTTPAPAPTSFEEIFGLVPEDRKNAKSTSSATLDAVPEEPAAQVSGDYEFWTSLLDSAKTRTEGPRGPPVDEDTIMVDADSIEETGQDAELVSPTFSESSFSASFHTPSPPSPVRAAASGSPLHYSRTYSHSASASADGTLHEESCARRRASMTEESSKRRRRWDKWPA